MQVIRDEAYQSFLELPNRDDWKGVRLKEVRTEALTPGGRTRLTLFESVGSGRPHPRLRVVMDPAQDPNPPESIFTVPAEAPATAAAVRELIQQTREAQAQLLAGKDLDPAQAPAGSKHYWKDSIRLQRVAQLFRELRAALQGWLDGGSLPEAERPGALLALHELEDEAYAGKLEFDDSDTGTYHSYGKDEPFVHYLEQLLESLPAEDGAGFALLPPQSQEALRHQRDQLQSHLDFLMRRKYAYEVIQETDIEKTVGGLLIDRDSRRIVSEVPDPGSLVPRYEMLRIDPEAEHPRAGAWLYRDGQGLRENESGEEVEVDAELLRSVSVPTKALTFRRAPKDERLRKGMRLDWNGDGHVQAGKIDWVSWAGHCDIKAVMEQLGVTLADEPSVQEYRSDSQGTHTYDRDLLLEMIASVLELGSSYVRADGSGRIRRGKTAFGGARNDSRPDRLQFKGPGAGKSFRWPLARRQEAFKVTGIRWGEETADVGEVFYRYRPDTRKTRFEDNPRFIKTVEGDYNLIDASGARISAKVKVDVFDPDTGYPGQEDQKLVIDLGPEGAGKRFFLGTHLADVVKRRLFRVYLDREKNQIVAEMEVYEQVAGEGEDAGKKQWKARPLPDETIELPLVEPLSATLSHEMRRDDPALFQDILRVAQRSAQNICADTDKKAPVWNGVVTELHSEKTKTNPEERTERWKVRIKARFGNATLDYLLRRDAEGNPEAYCPAADDDYSQHWPDFLWQDFPDVGSKGLIGRDWIVNETMLERGIVTRRRDRSVQGGYYVHDEHIKHVFELIYAALGGYPFTVVHADKRYGFRDEDSWSEAVAQLEEARAKVRFEGQDPGGDQPIEA